MSQKNIAILVFENADVLDVFGPLEVFVLAHYKCDLISVTNQNSLTLYGGVSINGSISTISDNYDLLIIPGGNGLNSFLKNHVSLNKIKNYINSEKFKTVASICAGALILDAIGFLDEKMAVTHWASKEVLKNNKSIKLVDARVVKDKNLYTSAGITAGIDLALQVVEDWEGIEKRKEIELLMEYKKSTNSFNSLFNQGYDNEKENIKTRLKNMIEERKQSIQLYRTK